MKKKAMFVAFLAMATMAAPIVVRAAVDRPSVAGQAEVSAPSLAAAAAPLPPQAAVNKAAANAAAHGVTEYISVVNRSNGAVVGQTSNAGSQVASESIMKLMIATYYIAGKYGGYTKTPASVLSSLSYMLRYSDDATADRLFTSSAIPWVAARYGMTATSNATDRAGHWGAARISAHDMTTFLYRASKDPLVGPWLIPVMASTAPNGSDGFNQHFGLNALTGVHGSKQGWGGDSYFTAKKDAIHSVGYTDKYFVAILQLSSSYPDPARATATYAAQLIAQSSTAPAPIVDGNFVVVNGGALVYRIAGGAPLPVTTWSEFGGPQPTRRITAAQFAKLRPIPADGTFIRDVVKGAIYRIAGGAPVYVTSWAPFGGPKPTVNVDPKAIAKAGAGGAFNHLRYYPADGTFLQGRPGLRIYRVTGGVPKYVASWAPYGGTKPSVPVTQASIDHAGTIPYFVHLRRA